MAKKRDWTEKYPWVEKKYRPPSGHTLDPGQRRAATRSDAFKKRVAEMPKRPKPILPFPRRPRPKPGLSPLPYPLPKKPRKPSTRRGRK